jgi:hypothetical protein
MNWKIEIVIAELCLLAMAFLVPFLLGRIGIKSPWPMLAGWLALTTWVFIFGFILSINAARHENYEMVRLLPEGPPCLLIVIFGWLPASYLGAWGERQRKKRDGK